jgi:hypothetical protein
MPSISGAAWSADEGKYHPTIFAQGSPVREGRLLSGAVGANLQAGMACDPCCMTSPRD